MGSTNKTTHYELSQFVGTDKPAWLQDYNGDMEKIDAGIYGAKTAADNAQSAADNAQGDATDALSGIADINTELGTVEGTLNTAVGNINTINSLIGNGTPTTTDQTIIGAINEINSGLGSVKNKIEGNYVLAGRYNVTIEPDGTKNYNQLITEAFNAFIADVDSDEFYDIKALNTAIGNYVPDDIAAFSGGSLPTRIRFISQRINATTAVFKEIEMKSDTSYAHTVEMNYSDGTMTYTNDSSDVPSVGQNLTMRVLRYKKV